MKSPIGSREIVDAASKPLSLSVASCIIVLYFLYNFTKFHFSAFWPLAPQNDAAIIYSEPQRIFAQAAYPPGDIFPYPPSAMLIFRALDAAGPAVFMGIWVIFTVAGLFVTMRASLAQERSQVRAAWLALGCVGMLFANSPISWDLHGANSNLAYLGLVMAGYGLLGCMPILAGALIGLSVSLKLYSGLLILWLFVSGSRRAVAAATATIVIFWVVLPIALFGMNGAVRLYSGWLEVLRTIADPTFHAKLAASGSGPSIVTLQRAVVHATGAAFGSATTMTYVWILRSIWLAALVWYGWQARKAVTVAAPSRAALADWVVILLAPLPLSPWLEPNHLVPLFVAAMLCIAIALDGTELRNDRAAALAALGTLLLFLLVHVPFDVRGFGLLAQLLALVLVLAFLRPRLRTSAEPDAEAIGLGVGTKPNGLRKV